MKNQYKLFTSIKVLAMSVMFFSISTHTLAGAEMHACDENRTTCCPIDTNCFMGSPPSCTQKSGKPKNKKMYDQSACPSKITPYYSDLVVH
jgi:hypothetical protein